MEANESKENKSDVLKSAPSVPAQRQWLIDLKPKDEVTEVYLVKLIQRQEAKDGKNYLVVLLADASGEIDSRIWHNIDQEFQKAVKGDYVKVNGKINFFQGKRQLVIQEMSKVDPKSIQAGDFVIRAHRSAPSMFDELVSLVLDLDDFWIRELLLSILRDEEIARRLCLWQAGKTMHHAYQSGLLEHILSCSHLALGLGKHYGLNQNYLLAGAILHDLAKIYELTDGPIIDYTEEGKLIGHLVKGLEIVDRFTYKLKTFPYPIKMHLKHLLVSHHGEFAYGSPKLPQTAEAMLLHLIDLMDSRMNMFESARRFDPLAGHWSMFMKHLDRPVFKADLPTSADFEAFAQGGQTPQAPAVAAPTQSPTKANSQGTNSNSQPQVKAQEKEKNGELKQNLGSLFSQLKK